MYEDNYVTVYAEEIARDEGSIVTFTGVEESTGAYVMFAVDHRAADDILAAIHAGEDAPCAVPSWAILSRSEVTS